MTATTDNSESTANAANAVDQIRVGQNAIDSLLVSISSHYEKSAPVVSDWADEMYRRISREPNGVSLSEVCFAARLFIGNQWMQPNYAANQLYKLLSSLGRDTTGMAGF
jgi:hypothetical protein